MRQSSALLFFIDGLGIGQRQSDNPLARIENIAPLAYFQNETPEIMLDGVLISTDAKLGVEGRPQSASGQTTILTGVNAPALFGYHKQGFPNEALRNVLAEHSIFVQLKNRGIEPNVFANAYTPQFFQTTPRWKSATTCAVEAARIPFRKLPDLINRFALFHDFTNEVLHERGLDAPLFSPAEAGLILARLASQHRFTLYEHFITDQIGHAQDFARAEIHLPRLAEMFRAVLQNTNLEETTVILTSDHGNLEDLSIRNHTLNDVPTVIWGKYRHEAARRIKSLADITPTIIKILENNTN